MPKKASLSKLLAQYAAEFARRGGKARAKKLTAEQRREIAKKAAQARWKKERKST